MTVLDSKSTLQSLSRITDSEHTSYSADPVAPDARHPEPPRWPSGKASASRAENPGFESCLRRDFFRVESYQ